MSISISLTHLLLILIIILCSLYLHLTYHQFSFSNVNSSSSTVSASANNPYHTTQDIEKMIHIIELQNQTIYALTHASSSSVSTSSTTHSVSTSLPLPLVIQQKDAEIIALKQKLNELNLQHDQEIKKLSRQHQASPSSSNAVSHVPSSPYSLTVPSTPFLDDCEQRYGMKLVDNWKQSQQTWCASPSSTSAKYKSSLTCYPYTQKHKNTPDIFCEATNFMIDFSKVSGDFSEGKAPRGDQYLSFSTGSLVSTCQKTNHFRNFMPHHSLQMRSAVFGASESDFQSAEMYDTPLYLLARDEDCENSFHSTADFMNMFLVYNALNVSPKDIQVMLFDKHPNGPYYDLIERAYSPSHPIIRHEHFQRKKVLFKKLIFHLESPAGLIFPKVANPDPLKCFSTGLFQGYRKHILQAFNLWDVPPPPIPSITLSLRHRTPQKNVGRIMANEKEVKDLISSVSMAKINVEDTAKMSFADQLKLLRNTNILIGIHGAGLMYIMFAAEEAILIEIHPSYRQDRHFRHAARMTNKIYMPVRATQRETCHGTSDNVVVPMEEFKMALDGALRIARSFDDGISECGIHCPPGLLAIDPRLDKYYPPGQKKSAPINTQFPC